MAGRLHRAPLTALDDVEVLCDLDEPEPDAGRLFVADVGVGAPAVRPFRGVLPG